jgi:hypothetical protein
MSLWGSKIPNILRIGIEKLGKNLNLKKSSPEP